MFYTLYLGVLLCVAGSQALYDSSSDVVDLTPSNFDRLVTNSDEVWIIEFYAPWCGHCKNLVPEYKKAAKALKGIIKVGAVDSDQHKSLSGKYGVTGFPTIKIFTGSKHTPYQGQRTADAFVDAGIKAAKDRAYDNLGKKSSGGSGDKRQVYGHNIPWKKIQRTIDRLGEKKLTPTKEKKQILRQHKLLSFRKPQVQKPLLSFRNPSVPKLRSQTSKQQAPVTHKKTNLDKLHEQLFRSNDQQNTTSQFMKRISHKTLVGKSKNQSSKPQVTGTVQKMKLDKLHLFRDNLDSAGEQLKRNLRSNKLKVPNRLKKQGNSSKQFRNRKLTKQLKKKNITILKKKILHTEGK